MSLLQAIEICAIKVSVVVGALHKCYACEIYSHSFFKILQWLNQIDRRSVWYFQMAILPSWNIATKYLVARDWSRVSYIYVSKLDHHWSWLVAWSTPSHYLRQCWNIIYFTSGIKSQWNLNTKNHVSFKEMSFKTSSAKWRQCCLRINLFAHWGRVIHICVSNPICLYNGLLPGRRQALSEPMLEYC